MNRHNTSLSSPNDDKVTKKLELKDEESRLDSLNNQLSKTSRENSELKSSLVVQAVALEKIYHASATVSNCQCDALRKDLKSKDNDNNRLLKEVKENIPKLKSENDDLNKELKRKEIENEKLVRALSSIKAKEDDHKQRENELERDIHDLKSRLKDTENAYSQLSIDKKQQLQSKADSDDLKRKMERDAAMKQQQIDSLQKKLEEKEDENRKNNERTKRLHQSELKKVIAPLNEEIEELKEKERQQGATISSLTKNDIAPLVEQIKELKGKERKQEATITRLNNDIAPLVKQIEELKEKERKQEANISNLKRVLQDTNEQFKVAKDDSIAKSAATEELASLRNKLRNAKNDIDRLQAENEQIDPLKAKLKNSENDLARKDMLMREKDENADNQIAALAEKLKKLQKENRQLEQDKKHLSTVLADKSDKISTVASDLGGSKTKIASLEQTIENLNDDINALEADKDKLANMLRQKDRDYKALESETVRHKEAIDSDIAQQTASRKKLSDQTQELLGELQLLQDQITGLKGDKSKLKQKLDSAEKNNAILESDLALTRKNAELAKKKLIAEQTEITASKADTNRLSTENANLKRKADASIREVEALEGRIGSLLNELKKANEDANDTRNKLFEATKQLSDSSRYIDDIESQLRSKENTQDNDKKTTRDTIQRMCEQLDSMRAQLEPLERDNNKLASENTALQMKVDEIAQDNNEELKALRNSNADFRSAHSELQAKLVENETALARANNENSELLRQLKRAQSDVDWSRQQQAQLEDQLSFMEKLRKDAVNDVPRLNSEINELSAKLREAPDTSLYEEHINSLSTQLGNAHEKINSLIQKNAELEAKTNTEPLDGIVNDLQQQNNRLLEEVKDLRRQMEQEHIDHQHALELLSKRENYVKTVENDKNSTISDLNDQVGDLKKENAHYKRQIAAIQEEVFAANEALKGYEKSRQTDQNVNSSQLNQQQQISDDLRRANKQLNDELALTESKLDRSRRRNNELKKEIDELRSTKARPDELSASVDRLNKTLYDKGDQSKMDKLFQELDNIRSSLSGNVENDSYRGKYHSLQAAFDQLKSESRHLKNDNDTLRYDLRQMQNAYDLLKADFKIRHEPFSSRDRDIDRIVSEQRQFCADAKTEFDRLRTQLNSNTEEDESAKKQLRRLKIDYEDANDEIARLKKKLKSNKRCNDNDNDDFQKIRFLKNEIDSLKNELFKAKLEVDHANASKCGSGCSVARGEISNVKAQIQKLNQILSESKKSAEVHAEELRRELSEKSSNEKSLKEQLMQGEAKLQELWNQLKFVEHSVSTVTSERDSISKDHKNCADFISKLENDKNALNTDLKSLISERDAALKELADYKHQFVHDKQAFDYDIRSLTDRVSGLESSLKEGHDRYSDVVQERGKLISILKEQENNLEQLQSSFDTLEKENNKLKQNEQNLVWQLERERVKCDELSNEIQNLKLVNNEHTVVMASNKEAHAKQISIMEEASRSNISDVLKRLSSSENDAKITRTELDNSLSANKELKSTISKLQNEFFSLNSNREELSLKLKYCEQRNADLIHQLEDVTKEKHDFMNKHQLLLSQMNLDGITSSNDYIKLRKHASNLEEEIVELNSSVLSLQKQLSTRTTLAAQMQSQLKSMEEDYTHSQVSFKNKLASLNGQVEQLENDKRNHQNVLKNVEEEARSNIARISSHYESELKTFDDNIAELNDQLRFRQNAEKNAIQENDELKRVIVQNNHDLESWNEQHSSWMRQKHAFEVDLESLSKKLENKENELNTWISQSKSLQLQLNDMEKQAQNIMEDASRVEKEKRRHFEKEQELLQQIDNDNKTVNQLKKQLLDIDARYASQCQDMLEMRSRLEQQTHENTSLRSRLKSSLEENDHLNLSMAKLRDAASGQLSDLKQHVLVQSKDDSQVLKLIEELKSLQLDANKRVKELASETASTAYWENKASDLADALNDEQLRCHQFEERLNQAMLELQNEKRVTLDSENKQTESIEAAKEKVQQCEQLRDELLDIRQRTLQLQDALRDTKRKLHSKNNELKCCNNEKEKLCERLAHVESEVSRLKVLDPLAKVSHDIETIADEVSILSNSSQNENEAAIIQSISNCEHAMSGLLHNDSSYRVQCINSLRSNLQQLTTLFRQFLSTRDGLKSSLQKQQLQNSKFVDLLLSTQEALRQWWNKFRESLYDARATDFELRCNLKEWRFIDCPLWERALKHIQATQQKNKKKQHSFNHSRFENIPASSTHARFDYTVPSQPFPPTSSQSLPTTNIQAFPTTSSQSTHINYAYEPSQCVPETPVRESDDNDLSSLQQYSYLVQKAADQVRQAQKSKLDALSKLKQLEAELNEQ